MRPRSAVAVAALAVVFAMAAAGLVTVAPGAWAAGARPADRRLFMVGDSVLLSAQAALVPAFAGYQLTIAGHPAIFTEDAAALVPANAANIGAVAVVATGYNYPYWDPARFDHSVDLMVTNLERAGAKRVIWVTLREVKPQFVSPGAWAQIQPYFWYFPTVNEHLRAAQARHPDLVLADWAAIADRTGVTYDAIHLNTAGGALMADLIRSEVEGVTRLRAGAELTVPVAGAQGVAGDAGGVALNVTVTDPRADGFVTVHPCGEARPLASNVNFVRGQTVANHVLTKPGAGGAVCVYASTDAHIVVDLDGWAEAGAGLAGVSPERLLDTRETHARVAPGAPVAFTARGGPAGAAAVIDVAAVAPEQAGFLTVAPCGPTPPLASSVNFAARQTIANLAVVPLGSDGTACVTSNTAADVVVDLVGWAGRGVTVGTARRVLDTRTTGGRATAGVLPVDVGTVPAGANAAVVTVTVTGARADGYAAVAPCGPPTPLASDLNFVAGGSAAALTVTALGAGAKPCVFTNVPADVVVDVSGWISTSAGYHALVPVRLHDTRDDPL